MLPSLSIARFGKASAMARTGPFSLAMTVAFTTAEQASETIQPQPAAGVLTPIDLRCEYRDDPLGIDVTSPRLSWIVSSHRRAQKQTAYHVLVASDLGNPGSRPGRLVGQRTDFQRRDHARLSTPANRCIRTRRASGRFGSGTRTGAPSAWSKTARWSMGLLDQAEWKEAAWIGSDKSRQVELPIAPFEGAKWIWHAGDKGASKPKGHRLFVTTLRLPAGCQGRKGRAARDGRRLLPFHDQRQPRRQRSARLGRMEPAEIRRRDQPHQAWRGEYDPRRGEQWRGRARPVSSPS